jgi:hypothetical protein
MVSGPYQILMLGSRDDRRVRLRNLVLAMVADLGLQMAVRFIDENDASARDRRAPLMAIFFGAADQSFDRPLLAELIQ